MRFGVLFWWENRLVTVPSERTPIRENVGVNHKLTMVFNNMFNNGDIFWLWLLKFNWCFPKNTFASYSMITINNIFIIMKL